MKVILINPRNKLFLKGENDFSMFPMGLASIASVIRENGFEMKVIDADTNNITPEQIAKTFTDDDVALVQINAGNSLYYAMDVIKEIRKQSNAKIITGGALAYSIPERILKETEADIVVMGEGEEIVIELLTLLKKGESIKKVKNIYYKEEDKINGSDEIATIKDLDKLPFPAWDLFNVEDYIHKPAIYYGKRCLPMVTSRGCPFSCKYCFPNHGRIWRTRSVDKIILEMKLLKEKYNIDGIQFLDDNFLINKKKIEDMCREIKKEKLDLKWACQARADSITYDYIKMIMDAGCRKIRLGVESGSERMLKLMNKNLTLKQVYSALDVLIKLKMKLRVGFILGMPNETKQDALETYKLVKYINKHKGYISIGYYYPLPKSEWYEYALERGFKERTLNEWAEQDKTKGFELNSSQMSDKELKRMYSKILMSNVLSSYTFHRGLLYLKKYGIKRIFGIIQPLYNGE